MIKPESISAIPQRTLEIARAAFPKPNLYMRLRDEFGALYAQTDFTALFSHTGQPAISPWRLALVTVFQFLENLSDRQAADAVRARIDWKYALSLELDDSGFDFSVLSEFRTRLLRGNHDGQLLLDAMLERFKDKGLLKARGRQRTDSTHVLASVRVLNRLELFGETMRSALNEIAVVAPDWLRGHAPAEWFERYSRRVEEYRLPKGKEQRHAHALIVGGDGFALLDAIEQTPELAALNDLPGMQTLRLAWSHHFERCAEGVIRLRSGPELPAAGVRFDSPYDTEAHFGNKRSLTWRGYKVHFSETCDDDLPHLITHVTTTNAVVPDVSVTDAIHEALKGKRLLPVEHFVDAGYVDAELIAGSLARFDVQLIGPVRQNVSWQAQTKGAFDVAAFSVDWDEQRARCPQGKTSATWHCKFNAFGTEVIHVRFRAKDCFACRLKKRCTRGTKSARSLLL